MNATIVVCIMHVYVKRIFVITEIMHMNAGVNSEKEKVKESQSQSRSVTPPLDTTSCAGLWASQFCGIRA